ncbi:MAG: MATE family efflux transporter [Clostridia bacterium]
MHQDEQLGTMPIGKLVFKLAIPAVFAQLVNVLYNIVDRIYIGHIPVHGAKALTGLGVCFPILALISAFSAFVGAGGAPLATIQLGQKNRDRAEKILGNGVMLLIVFSAILTVFFMIFKEPLLYAFGASAETIPYALDYLRIYIMGTIFVQLALGLNTFISSQGFASTAMLSVLIGAVANIVLDPIFIFGFEMGVKGAAWATILSQALSALWVVCFLVSKRSGLHIKLSNMKPNLRILGSIAALGISPFIMQATESLVSITLNSSLQHYGGDLHVGAMAILQSVMQLIVIPIMGFAQGTQPILSYNFGARKNDRVKKAFYIVLLTTFSAAIVCCLLTVFIPHVFARLFTPDEALVALVSRVMPIYMAGIWIFGVQMACQSTLLALGQAKISLFLALLRKAILLVPLALILPRFFGVTGIYFAEPAADILAATTTGVLFLLRFQKILREGPERLNG